MNMIDRFLSLVNEVEENKKNPSLTRKWKIKHRKYEILTEIKNNYCFTVEELFHYAWILEYGKNKSNFKIPFNEFLSVCVGRFFVMKYDTEALKFEIRTNPEIREDFDMLDIHIEVLKDGFKYFKPKYVSNFLTRMVITEDDQIFEILKELLKTSLESLIDTIIKGD